VFKVKTMKEWEELYDRVYAVADSLIKRYDPCRVEKVGKGVICADRGRSYLKFESARNVTCCECCVYLGPNGCTVKCISCKLFLCREIADQHPELDRKLKRLWDMIPYAWRNYRKSKCELMALLKEDIRDGVLL